MKGRKKNWFDLGVSALRSRLPDVPASYLCPLCLMNFNENELDQLTFEHVPPRSLGGRELVLTCCNCNKHASGKDGVDTHAKKRENILDFTLGTMTSSHRARYIIKNTSQEVRVISSGGGILISGVPEANPPNRGQDIQHALESMASNEQIGTTFNISLYRDVYSLRIAAISYLRAGYLAAFAAFGYTYILGVGFDSVRNQIAKPKDYIISGFSMTVPQAEPRERNIALPTNPSWLRALAIQMGRHVVFLPINSGDQRFYDVLHNHSKESAKLSLEAKAIFRWPETPKFVCDFA